MKSFIFLLRFFTLFCFAKAYWVKQMENEGMYEGDMILSPDQLEAAEKGEIAAYASTHQNLWPKTIYYDWAPELANNPAILAAIKDYEKYTCLRFIKRTNQRDYIHFFRGPGCFSGLGYFKGLGKHRISIGVRCLVKGIVIHELAHMLGIYHEQSRPDRDDYVTINMENVISGREMQFKKQKTSDINYYGTKYDYRSIMHYGALAFSKNVKNTITTKDPAMQNVIGYRGGFSEIDKIQINRMYKCHEDPVTTLLPKPAGPFLIKHYGGKCLGVDSDNNLIFTQKCYTYFKEINGGQLILTGGASRCVEPRSNDSELVVKPKCKSTWDKTAIKRDGSFIIRHKQTGKCIRPKFSTFFPREGYKLVIYSDCNHEVSRFRTIQK